MMMEAYFDESGTHYGSPVMCVAGYLLSAEQALHLDREWKLALAEFGVSHFHAVDCTHGIEEFANLSQERRRELVIRLIGIIKRRVEIGIAVSVSETAFGTIDPPEWLKGGPYLIAAMQVLVGVVAWAEKYRYEGKFSFFFEAGHHHQNLTNAAIDQLRSNLKRSGKPWSVSHTFGSKRDHRPLQAADILAYEWYRELRRLNEPPVTRPMRRCLESLLEKSHIQQHLGPGQLVQLFKRQTDELWEHMKRFTPVE